MTEYLCHSALWSALWFLIGFILGLLAHHLRSKRT